MFGDIGVFFGLSGPDSGPFDILVDQNSFKMYEQCNEKLRYG